MKILPELYSELELLINAACIGELSTGEFIVLLRKFEAKLLSDVVCGSSFFTALTAAHRKKQTLLLRGGKKTIQYLRAGAIYDSIVNHKQALESAANFEMLAVIKTLAIIKKK